MGKILTVDLGTTYLKFSLVERNGRLRHTSRVVPPLADTPSDRMELPADAFCTAIAQGIGELGRWAGGLTDVEAVGFATQTNSFALLDANQQPLTPLVLWPDLRAADLADELRARCSGTEFHATTGLPLVGGQFAAAKLLWYQCNHPQLWQQARRICLISDYLTYLFTGRWATEGGAAGLTGLVDIHHCRWWPEMLDRFGIDQRWLPEVVRAGTDLGPILPTAAEKFGLPRTCRFVVGCLDQYAGAIGAGNVAPGMVSETTGTVLATVRSAERFSTQLGPEVFQGPSFAETLYWRMAFGEVSANYLHWYREQLPEQPDFEELTALAAEVEPGADGLRLRPDVRMTDVAAVFTGMVPQHTTGHFVRAIMEAVASALARQVGALAQGERVELIRCAGGGARSDLWLQIKADMLGVPTAATACPEPTSLGAAILAEASLSGAEVPDVARQWVCLNPSHSPDRQQHLRYRELGLPPEPVSGSCQ